MNMFWEIMFKLCVLICCICTLIQEISFLKRFKRIEKEQNHLQRSITILARRMKGLDGMEMKEIQYPQDSITILINPEEAENDN